MSSVVQPTFEFRGFGDAENIDWTQPTAITERVALDGLLTIAKQKASGQEKMIVGARRTPLGLNTRRLPENFDLEPAVLNGDSSKYIEEVNRRQLLVDSYLLGRGPLALRISKLFQAISPEIAARKLKRSNIKKSEEVLKSEGIELASEDQVIDVNITNIVEGAHIIQGYDPIADEVRLVRHGIPKRKIPTGEPAVRIMSIEALAISGAKPYTGPNSPK
jgi:hypothetical protein